MLDICVRWIDSPRLNPFFPQKEILAVLEALISRPLAQPDQLVFVISKHNAYFRWLQRLVILSF
jgi:hypothetical protein